MIFILSASLNDHKKITTELVRLFGIGRFQAILLCNRLGFGFDRYTVDLKQKQVYQLLKYFEQADLKIEAQLQKQKRNNIAELINLKSYRGVRHIFNLPVRGQRTRTNAKSIKLSSKYKNE
jgi:small subunit ribosomal protein S13